MRSTKAKSIFNLETGELRAIAELSRPSRIDSFVEPDDVRRHIYQVFETASGSPPDLYCVSKVAQDLMRQGTEAALDAARERTVIQGAAEAAIGCRLY